jgi:hypothetical protein
VAPPPGRPPRAERGADPAEVAAGALDHSTETAHLHADRTELLGDAADPFRAVDERLDDITDERHPRQRPAGPLEQRHDRRQLGLRRLERGSGVVGEPGDARAALTEQHPTRLDRSVAGSVECRAGRTEQLGQLPHQAEQFVGVVLHEPDRGGERLTVVRKEVHRLDDLAARVPQ